MEGDGGRQGEEGGTGERPAPAREGHREGVLASAPGKTILMGEHAVVYGRPALVAAVGLRARALLRPSETVSPDHLVLDLPDVDYREPLLRSEVLEYARAARDSWRRYREAGDRRSFAAVRGEDPAHLVKVAIGEAMRRVDGADDPPRRAGPDAPRPEGHGRGLAVEVRSDVPIGRGFGSSAAVGAAVAVGWLAYHDAGMNPRETESLLLDVERRQHGTPSGVDGATVLHGGLIWAEEGDESQGLRCRTCSPASDLLGELQLFDTGPPAQETGEVVAAVREFRERQTERVEAVLEEMGRTTVQFRRLLTSEDPDRGTVVDAIRTYERGLEALNVVPEPVRELIRRVEREGGAAKISGAGALGSPPDGGPGGGLLLVYHPEPGRVSRWPFLSDLPRFGVRFGVEGTELERHR